VLNQKTILVIEDDPSIRVGLVDAIVADGHNALSASSGHEGVTLFFDQKVDVVLLDIMLPEMNGYDVCRKIRETDKQVPIIMLTAKDEEIDKVLGLELGADDYMTKPFGIRELLARIHAALRRMDNSSPTASPIIENNTITFGDLEIDRRRFHVIRGNETFPLTMRELRLLEVFAERPNEVLSRDFLLNAVWGVDYFGTTRTLDQHIAQLRKKVETPNSVQLIVTVHGVGYKYNS
jgi:DNA-binding response OmpR family regulator